MHGILYLMPDMTLPVPSRNMAPNFPIIEAAFITEMHKMPVSIMVTITSGIVIPLYFMSVSLHHIVYITQIAALHHH